MALEKHRIDSTPWDYPARGGRLKLPLVSKDQRENFFLEISRSRINIAKGTYQNRGRQVVVLARLDFGGAPHRNPDGKEIGSPHLHLYREGFGDRLAVSVPRHQFASLRDPWQTLIDFMQFCNVVQAPVIRRGLFE